MPLESTVELAIDRGGDNSTWHSLDLTAASPLPLGEDICEGGCRDNCRHDETGFRTLKTK